MEYIKIKKDITDCYEHAEYSNRNILFLGRFLIEVYDDYHWWIEWVSNNSFNEAENNISWLEKRNDEILIGFLFDKSDDKYKDAFKISSSGFVNLLAKWNEFVSNNIPEFMIIFEDGKIDFQEMN